MAIQEANWPKYYNTGYDFLFTAYFFFTAYMVSPPHYKKKKKNRKTHTSPNTFAFKWFVGWVQVEEEGAKEKGI